MGAQLLTLPLHGYPTPVDFDGDALAWDLFDHPGGLQYAVEGETPSLAFYTPTVHLAALLWSSVDGSRLRLRFNASDPDITIQLQDPSANDFSSGYAVFDQVDPVSGNPIHCLAVVEAQNNTLSTAKTILHEIGHCLGLGHSMVPESIMSYQLEENTFALAIDDEGVVSRLYPSNGDDPQIPLGCGIGTQNHHSDKLGWWFVLPLLAVYLRRDKTISG